MKTLVQFNWFRGESKYNFYFNSSSDLVLSKRYIDVMPLLKVRKDG